MCGDELQTVCKKRTQVRCSPFKYNLAESRTTSDLIATIWKHVPREFVVSVNKLKKYVIKTLCNAWESFSHSSTFYVTRLTVVILRVDRKSVWNVQGSFDTSRNCESFFQKNQVWINIRFLNVLWWWSSLEVLYCRAGTEALIGRVYTGVKNPPEYSDISGILSMKLTPWLQQETTGSLLNLLANSKTVNESVCLLTMCENSAIG